MTELINRIKEYWNKQPCNIKHGTSTIGTVDFFSEVSKRRHQVEPHIKDFAGFHIWQGKRVLEVGCGIGSDAEEFVKHGADYTGIDISDESINLSKQRFQILNLNGRFLNRDASSDLTDLGKFDLIYSYGVIHHFPNIEQTIQNIYNVLDSGGEFRFMVYAKNSWKYAMIQKGLDQYEAQSGCPYAQAYTHNDIYRLLSDKKWQIARLRQAHCFMYNVDEYNNGNYVLEPWFEAMTDDVKDAVREYLGWHLLVKAVKI